MVAMHMGLGMWIRGMRPRTLPLGLASVLAASLIMIKPVLRGGLSDEWPDCPWIGGRTALSDGGTYRQCLTTPGWYVAVALLCAGTAVFLQIAANFANDYSDGVRGTDEGRVGIGSSGESASRTAPARLVASGVSPKCVLMAAGVHAALACVCGLAVTVLTGHWWFIALGLICLAAGWGYVGGRRPYGYHGWGEVSVFVFFGLVATCGTAYALDGTVPFAVVWTAVAIGLLDVAVLCINNLRDLDEDGLHGKRTWMVRLGWRRGSTAASVLMTLPPLMLLVALVMRRPWVAGSSSDAAVCDYARDGAVLRCVTATMWSRLGVFVAVVVLLVVSAMAVAVVRAIGSRAYRAALPMCALCAPVLAIGFGSLTLLP